MTAPYASDPTTAHIGLAICATTVIATAAHYAWAWWQTRRATSFDDHCDTTPGLDQMPLEDRMAHVFAEQVEDYLREVAPS